MLNGVLTLPRRTKQLTVVAVDLATGLFAMWLAFSLRLDMLHWPQDQEWLAYLLGPLLAIPVFVRFGLYRAIFRYTGLSALATTAKAVLAYAALLSALLMIARWPGVPRSVGVLQPLIFLLLVAVTRATAKFWLAGNSNKPRRADGRLLIYGAGAAGVQTARALESANQYLLLGYVDDDPAKAGRSIDGVPVFAARDVKQVVARQNVTDILLAVPSASRDRRNQIIESLQTLPVHVRTLPAMSDLASGRVTVRDFRELDVEDLLGRPPVPPNPELLAHNLAAKVVLVSGAGGSIGSELCRQILLEQPRQLLLLEHNEFALYSIHQELLRLCVADGRTTRLVPLLGSVYNYKRLSDILRTYRPDTVYHAAAYKHVPLVEHNPAEGVLNNVFGTLHLVRAAIEANVATFVLVSTDKAVRPTNVMGASKRVAEQILQALSTCDRPRFHDVETASEVEVKNRTRMAMVRFGNVLGSSGSVVPLFRQQIAAGGPITVTDPEVTRYFMTIPEAAQLVLQAGAMARGGDVFVLDMGEPVKIIDLARRMVELSGVTLRDAVTRPDGDIEIVTTGLRSGEKLYEELLIGESPQPSAHPRIMMARERFLPWTDLRTALQQLRTLCLSNEVANILRLLQRLVPEAQFGSGIQDYLTADTAVPTAAEAL